MLCLLAKEQLLTNEEWAAVIDARLAMMNRFLNFMPARELQKVQCIHNGYELLSLYYLQRFNIQVFQNCQLDVTSKFFCEQLGIYEAVEEMKRPDWMPWDTGPAKEKLVLWGLTRGRKWLTAWADFDVYARTKDGLHLGSSACITSIVVKGVSTLELIEELDKRKICSPHRIVDLLFREYTEWFAKYDERHSEAEALNTIMQVEQALVTRIP
jgi:hypothetical protein